MNKEILNQHPVIEKLMDMQSAELQDFIFRVEEELLKYPQTEVPINDYFGHDTYGREMIAPAGVYLTGAVHNYEVLNILLEGEVTVVSIDGVATIKAPYVYVSRPNVKRLFLTHTQIRWMNVFGTKDRNTKRVMKRYTHNDKEKSCQLLLQP